MIVGHKHDAHTRAYSLQIILQAIFLALCFLVAIFFAILSVLSEDYSGAALPVTFGLCVGGALAHVLNRTWNRRK